MGKQKKNYVLLYSLILVLVLIIVDQTSKIWFMIEEQTRIIIPNILEFQRVKNTGGAFGVGQNNTATFVITNIVVLGLIIRFIWLQKERMEKKMLTALSVILAGGIGNLIDRLIRGFVVDFIRIFPETNFPVFNMADIFIVLGWIALAFIFAKYSYEEIKIRKNKEVIK